MNNNSGLVFGIILHDKNHKNNQVDVSKIGSELGSEFLSLTLCSNVFK
jgi:hypothetical protein